MGRLVPCSTALPNHTRRSERAARAKETVNKSIPDILRGSPRARHGIHEAERIVDPPASDSTVNMEREPGTTHIKIRLLCEDTLSAARRMSERPFAKSSAPSQRKQQHPNVAVLNFASPLRAGGGFLDGANSQEEFLCARTTLYAALWDKFYRLPEVGGVYAREIVVFRDSLPEANELMKRDRYFIDVISSGMLRFPDMKGRSMDEEPDCTCGISYCNRDRELVINKMKAVLRIAEKKGNKKLILGAWGCGAYGNPVDEVAKLWRKVIAGGPRQRKANTETWSGIEEIVFAIPDRSMIPKFEKSFEDILSKEPIPRRPEAEPVKDEATQELLDKILQIETQLDLAVNRRQKARLQEVLATLNRNLSQSLANKAAEDDDLTQQEDEEVDGSPSSELDDNVFMFDENDVVSGSSDGEHSEDYLYKSSGECPSPKFDHETGWFNGSMDELTRMLKLKTGSKLSEISSPASLRDVADDFNEITIRSYLKKYGGSDALSPGHSVA